MGNFQYFSIPIGFVGPALGLSLGWSVIAGALGIVVGTLFMAFHASQGPRLGLPQMIQSRAQFGYRGVLVPLFATLFTYLAFNVTDQVLMSQGLNKAFGLNATAVAVVVAALAAVIAIWGHDWVHRVFRSVLVFSLPIVTILSVGVIFGLAHGHAPSQHLGFTLAAFMAQFSAAAAYNITYAPYVSDYSRYLPHDTPTRKVIGSVFFGAAAAPIWLIALGAWLAIRLGATDGLLGTKEAGNNFFHPPGQRERDSPGRWTGGDDGHERLWRHAERAHGNRLHQEDQADARRPHRHDPRSHGGVVRDRPVDLVERRQHGGRFADPDAVPAGAVDGH